MILIFSVVDSSLSRLVPQKDLQLLASFGLRGEIAFSIPYLLELNPFLLGYYRMLLGFSQKAFYDDRRGLGFGAFSSMEKKGTINEYQKSTLEELCSSLIKSSSVLLNSMRGTELSVHLLNELSLLTLGAQLRGSRNNTLGASASRIIFDIIERIVENNIIHITDAEMLLKNAAGRETSIRFAADPDIIITEKFVSGRERNLVAIEIKGGTDYSNAHNRLGEAEKSHQKAKAKGFTEFWTLTGFAIGRDIAKQESPTTTEFFNISSLLNQDSEEYCKFRENIAGLTGIVESE